MRRGGRSKLLFRVNREDTWELADGFRGGVDYAIADFHESQLGDPGC